MSLLKINDYITKRILPIYISLRTRTEVSKSLTTANYESAAFLDIKHTFGKFRGEELNTLKCSCRSFGIPSTLQLLSCLDCIVTTRRACSLNRFATIGHRWLLSCGKHIWFEIWVRRIVPDCHVSGNSISKILSFPYVPTKRCCNIVHWQKFLSFGQFSTYGKEMKLRQGKWNLNTGNN